MHGLSHELTSIQIIYLNYSSMAMLYNKHPGLLNIDFPMSTNARIGFMHVSPIRILRYIFLINISVTYMLIKARI